MKQTVILIFLLTFALICQAEERKIRLVKSAKDTKQGILKKIPIGSSIEEAQNIMEANGFICKKKEGGAFSEQDNDGKATIHKGIDYLYCDKEMPESPYCVRRWQVAIVDSNGVVSDILVSTGLICV